MQADDRRGRRQISRGARSQGCIRRRQFRWCDRPVRQEAAERVPYRGVGCGDAGARHRPCDLFADDGAGRRHDNALRRRGRDGRVGGRRRPARAQGRGEASDRPFLHGAAQGIRRGCRAGRGDGMIKMRAGSSTMESFTRRFSRRCALAGLAATGLSLGSLGAQAQNLDKLDIVVFSAPSLGAFMPPVIKAKKLDQANGLDITFQERTPDAYQAQFNSGEFKVGGSASLLQVALGNARGVKVQYLFNLFDFWGAVVTSRPEVKTLKDLEGKQLVAARATTNYVMFEFFAKKLGVDVSKLQVVNTATPGLVGYAIADRADAVQLWEPAYTLLLAKKPSIRTLDTDMQASWKAFAGGTRIPYLGV